MAITPAEIDQLTFSPSKHGYDTDEVDNFLERLSSEVDQMLQKIADLKGRLTASEAQLAEAQNKVVELQSQPVVSATQVTTSSTGASEAQISQVLIVAQQSADKMVAEAKENAEKIRTEADQKARQVIRQALAEKQSELDEMDRLKASRESFRDEYKALLQKFMDDADNAFAEKLVSSVPTGSAAIEVPVSSMSEAAPETSPVFPTISSTEPVDADATVLVPQTPLSGVDVDDLD